MTVMVSRTVELVLVRHGETANNKARVLQGQLDTPLSDHGIRQAECVGQYLKDVTFSHAISSSLSRALQTGQAIVNANPSLKGKEIELSTLLLDRNCGEFEGQGIEVWKQAMAEVGGENWDYDSIQHWGPRGGETGHQFRERVRQFLADVCKKTMTSPSSEDLRFLITTHCGNIAVIRLLLEREHSCSMPAGQSSRGIPNTAVTRFSLYLDEEGKIVWADCTLLYYNGHLKELES